MNLGLLGKNISYSFSQNYFSQKFKTLGLDGYTYQIFDIQDKKDIPTLFEMEELNGFNITIPYKQEIIKYLDELSPEAEKIGAVNTVKISGNKKTGYNTDAVGFKNSLIPLLKPHHTSALILGSGGASKAVAYVLNSLQIDYLVVSRTGNTNYDLLDQKILDNHPLIINTTPVGTFPNIEHMPSVPFEHFTPEHLVYDLIYNPEETRLLTAARNKGAQIKNGLEMLHLQAEAAWDIWNS
ncbi:shikimate dehydrogenase [Apibacter raozihei]|uniref:shikimate dehydrogenase family protein n=1 Tax=Apibacter raozihei TaxID=2500547 RepID=UPI000FE40DA8|nr:shikimate dehydrogenase [Apibacter raozihei]